MLPGTLTLCEPLHGHVALEAYAPAIPLYRTRISRVCVLLDHEVTRAA